MRIILVLARELRDRTKRALSSSVNGTIRMILVGKPRDDLSREK